MLSWFRNAQPEEKGSFCDVDSEKTYNNLSLSETLDQMRSANERGDDLVDETVVGFYEGDTTVIDGSQRVNFHMEEEDNVGHTYTPRERPGK